MSLKNYTNSKFVIVAKINKSSEWQQEIECIPTPTTVTFAISSNNEQDINKITWDFGTGNQQKSLTNRKQELNMHEIDCKYKKSHNSTITIQASVYTDDNTFIVKPITTITINQVLKEHYVEPEVFKNQILEYYKTNEFSNEVADSIYKIANRLAFAGNFINYCVDEETEALTRRGWMKYNQIQNNDEILSYDIKTNNLKWSKIKDIFINQNYNGPMHKITNQGLDAVVTPGHRFVTKERGLIKIEDIKTKEHIILMGDPENHNTFEYYDDNFVKLVGWAVTEGNYLKGKRTHSLQIFQKEGPKAQQIRNCLNSLNISYKEYSWTNPEIKGFRFNKHYANFIINQIAPDKILSPDFIVKLNQRQREILIDTMIKGDGWIVNQKGRKPTFGYTQKNKNHIDNFLMLCTLSGLTTSCEKIINNTSFGKSEYYNVYFYRTPKQTCSVEHTNFYGGKPKPGGNLKNGKVQNVPTQQYKGTVWCPKTEYGTFICRRGKYIFVTGNTYREEMVGDAVIRMIEALTSQKFDPLKGNPFSYFTKIAFHAFCNRIKKEKKARQTLLNYQNEIYGNMKNEGILPYNHSDNDLDFSHDDIEDIQ